MQVTINYLALLASGFVALFLGMIYYGPLFGERWMKLVGISKEDMNKAKKQEMLTSMVLGFVSYLVMAWVLTHFIAYAGYLTWQEGLKAGGMVWLGFVATTTLGNVIWEKKPWELYFINNLYSLLNLLAMGVILTLWS